MHKIDNSFLKAYNFYDNKGRRLSIFGKLKENSIIIFIITCSKKDKFSKNKAKELLSNYLFKYVEGDEVEDWKPKIEVIPCTLHNFKTEFTKFCYRNFYKKRNIQVNCSANMLYGNSGTNILLKDTLKRNHKWEYNQISFKVPLDLQFKPLKND